MKGIKKILVLCMLLSVSQVSSVYSVDHKSIDDSFKTIKYLTSSSSGDVVTNLYSSSVDYADLLESALVYVSNPNIQAIVYYNSMPYELFDYAVAHTTNRPDGETRDDYVATYVFKSFKSSVQTYASTVNNGALESIYYSVENAVNFDVDSSITSAVGTGGDLFGFEAKCEIRSFINRAAGFGSGYNFTLKYEFDEDELEMYANYSIKKKTDYYYFISIVHVSKYESYTYWFQKRYRWLDYDHYAYITNAIVLETYSLVES